MEVKSKVMWTGILGGLFFVLVGLTGSFTFAAAPDGWPKDWPAYNDELVAKGKAVYKVNCDTCHGPKGDGQGIAGKMLQPPPRGFADPKGFKKGAKPADLYKSIKEGLPGTAMAPFGHIPDADLKALVAYVLTFQKAKK